MNPTAREGLDDLRVIGDIGGTHARFALARHGAYSHMQRVDVDRYHSLFEAMHDYLAALGPELKPSSAVIDVAGPVRGDHVKMTNLAWSFSAPPWPEGVSRTQRFRRGGLGHSLSAESRLLPDRAGYPGREGADRGDRSGHGTRRRRAGAGWGWLDADPG
jgi:hypothetical protein